MFAPEVQMHVCTQPVAVTCTRRRTRPKLRAMLLADAVSKRHSDTAEAVQLAGWRQPLAALCEKYVAHKKALLYTFTAALLQATVRSHEHAYRSIVAAYRAVQNGLCSSICKASVRDSLNVQCPAADRLARARHACGKSLKQPDRARSMLGKLGGSMLHVCWPLMQPLSG
jgi:hypothetical protein